MPSPAQLIWVIQTSKIPDYHPSNKTGGVSSCSLQLCPTIIGQWMRHKWHVRKGYLKLHVAVDIKNKKIISLEVTSEEVHDGKMLKKLVDNASENNNLKGVLADGMYDSNKNFRYLSKDTISLQSIYLSHVSFTSITLQHNFQVFTIGYWFSSSTQLLYAATVIVPAF